jgi:hypothetical protein
LDIGIKEDSSINALRQATMELVANQRLVMQAGQMTAGGIAGSKLQLVDDNIIDGELTDG